VGGSSDEDTRSIPVEELDALLESAGSGCEGATTSLSAGELDDLLVPGGPGSGFGQRPSATGARGDQGAPRAALGLDDELGAAFDAFSDPAPPHDPERDSQPTSIDAAPPLPTSVVERPEDPGRSSDPATIELHAWGRSDEPATVDLRSWTAASQGAAPAAPPIQALPPPPYAPRPASHPPRPASHAPPPAPHAPPPASHAPPPASYAPPPLSYAPPPAFGAPQYQVRGEATFTGSAFSRGSRAGMIAALTMSVITVVGITAYLLTRSPGPEDVAGGAPSGSARAAPAPAVTGAAKAAPVPRSEAEARAALRRLGDGVVTCARKVIGVLPGTSPPVPASFRLMKEGLYTSLPGDYRSPVWSCTGFRQAEPQPFQIQWQVFKGGAEGMAIVWLDMNGDRAADRALGLRARLVKQGEVALSDDIEILEPIPAVIATR
jgi:hypothetical protein